MQEQPHLDPDARWGASTVQHVVGIPEPTYHRYAAKVAPVHPGRGRWRSYTTRDVVCFALVKLLMAAPGVNGLDAAHRTAAALVEPWPNRLPVWESEPLPGLEQSIDAEWVRRQVEATLLEMKPVNASHGRRITA